MLKLKENANGKFDIVISDGFKSQLHGRSEKKVQKQPRQGINLNKKNVTKPTKGKDSQLRQNKSFPNEASTTVPKAKKSTRIAAKFNETTDNKDPSVLPKNKSASFVTKSDLDNLLKVLDGSEERQEKCGSELVTKQSSLVSKEDELLSSSNLVNAPDDGGSTNKMIHTEPDTSRQSNPPIEAEVNTHSIEITKPAAMRSSFAIGAPGIVVSDPYNDKTTKFKLWKDELEKQINEKKLKDLQRKLADDVEQDGNAKENYFQPTDRSPVRTFGESSKQEPVERGRGLMNLIGTDQAEIQRRKLLEHQRAVEQQVEDRRRQKQEEKERRLREDALEEARLAKETAELQRQFEEELRKNREKEEQVKKRAHHLQEQISKAFQSSQQIKREKRKNMLQSSVTERVTNNSSAEKKEPFLSSPNQRPVNKSIKYDDEAPVEYSDVADDSLVERRKERPDKRLSRISGERDVTRSYSEPALVGRSQDSFGKWVEEDIGSGASFDRNQHVYDESNEVSPEEVPFYRTKSASLLLDSVTDLKETQRTARGGEQNWNHDQNKGNKVIKRQIPEVQPIRKSISKGTAKKDVKKTSLNRHEKQADVKQKTSKTTSSVASRSVSDSVDVDTNMVPLPVEITHPRTTMNLVPANTAPTAHQERILEQLSALRKGLLAKDQEFRTRLLNMPEYEIST